MITSGHYITKNSLKYKLYSNNLLALNDELFSRCRRPGIFIYMMPSNVRIFEIQKDMEHKLLFQRDSNQINNHNTQVLRNQNAK